jgi:hypothetical protein
LEKSNLDSVRSGPTQYDINFVVEVFYRDSGHRQASAYLLELPGGSNKPTEGTVRYIGKHDWSVRSVQTPGDFYYFMMTMQREGNILALLSCIRDDGYPTSISDGTEESPYSASKIIKKDSIIFGNLGIEFDLYNVNFHFNLEIDEAFSEDGNARLGYSGGGFYNAISISKKGNNVFLEGYSFSGH